MRLKTSEWTVLAIPVIAAGMFFAAPAPPQIASRLVSVQHIPDYVPLCEWNESSAADPQLVASLQQENLFSTLPQDSKPVLMVALQQGIADLPQTDRQEREAREARARGARTPVRTIRDTAPTYSAVAVDVNSDEVILQDNNLWSYRVFDRLSKMPPDNEISKPSFSGIGLVKYEHQLFEGAWNATETGSQGGTSRRRNSRHSVTGGCAGTAS